MEREISKRYFSHRFHIPSKLCETIADHEGMQADTFLTFQLMALRNFNMGVTGKT